MERDSREWKKRRRKQYNRQKRPLFIGICRLPPCACVLVWSDGSCGEPMFFNLRVLRSGVCERVYVCVKRQVWLWPRLESLLIFLCVRVILRQERHRLLHMKCYSYKAAVAWLSPHCSTRQPAGETQQNKSQREITDCLFLSGITSPPREAPRRRERTTVAYGFSVFPTVNVGANVSSDSQSGK